MIDHRYQTFLAVSETLSFTAAAQKLGLTQPAVSTHIRSLEEELGVTLINRDKRALNLTYQGEILVKYAKRMQSIEDNLQRKIADSKKGVKSLVIGITHTSESTIAPEILAYYSRQGRGTYIRIVSDSINNLYDMLSSFQIDLAIIEGNITNRKVSSILLDTDSIMAIVSKENRLSAKRVLTIDDLKKERVILRNVDSGTTTLFANSLNKLDMGLEDINAFLELDNVASIKDLVRKNMGISVLPRSACLDEMKAGTLVAIPIENMSMIRQISLVYIPGNVQKEILDNIVGIYREKISEEL